MTCKLQFHIGKLQPCSNFGKFIPIAASSGVFFAILDKHLILTVFGKTYPLNQARGTRHLHSPRVIDCSLIILLSSFLLFSLFLCASAPLRQTIPFF